MEISIFEISVIIIDGVSKNKSEMKQCIALEFDFLTTISAIDLLQMIITKLMKVALMSIESTKACTESLAASSPSFSLINTNLVRNISFNGPQKADIIVVRNDVTNTHMSFCILTPKYFAVNVTMKMARTILAILRQNNIKDVFPTLISFLSSDFVNWTLLFL